MADRFSAALETSRFSAQLSPDIHGLVRAFILPRRHPEGRGRAGQGVLAARFVSQGNYRFGASLLKKALPRSS